MFKAILAQLRNRFSKGKNSLLLLVLITISSVLLFTFFFTIGNILFNPVYDIEVLTATEGGHYEKLGKSLAGFFSERDKIKIHPVHTNGDEENLRRLNEQWSGNTFAFNTIGSIKIWEYKNKISPDQRHNAPKRILFPIKGQSMMYKFATDASGINSLADLKKLKKANGERYNVYIGRNESGTRLVSEEIFKHFDIPIDSLNTHDFHDLSFKEAAQALKEERLDFVIMVGNYLDTETGYLAPEAVNDLMTLMGDRKVHRVKWSATPATDISKFLADMESQLGGSYFYQIDDKNRIDSETIYSTGVLITHKRTRPYLVWEVLQKISKSSNHTNSILIGQCLDNLEAGLDTLKNSRTFNMAFHEGVSCHYSNYSNLKYKVKRVLFQGLTLFMIIIYLAQLAVVVKINDNIKKMREGVTELSGFTIKGIHYIIVTIFLMITIFLMAI